MTLLRHSQISRLTDPETFVWATGIEDTFITEPWPKTGRTLDEYELTGHYERWKADLGLMKEIGVSALNGLIWGSVVGLFAFLIYHNWQLGVVLTGAMVLSLMLAAVMGVTIPLAMQKLGRDPALGASVIAFDPHAREAARAELGELVSFASDPYTAVDGRDALVIATEWPEFVRAELARVKAAREAERQNAAGRSARQKLDAIEKGTGCFEPLNQLRREHTPDAAAVETEDQVAHQSFGIPRTGRTQRASRPYPVFDCWGTPLCGLGLTQRAQVRTPVTPSGSETKTNGPRRHVAAHLRGKTSP